MLSSVSKVGKFFGAGLISLLLISCGGGGSGGFTTGAETLDIRIRVAQSELPANLQFLSPSLVGPYTTSVLVTVQERATSTPALDGTVVNMSVSGVSSGGISKLDDPSTPEDEFSQLFGALDNQTSAGQAQYFFTSFSTPGTVTLTASVFDESSGRTLKTTAKITVLPDDRPTASLTFTGPFVNAVIAGVATFGTADAILLDGSYQRIVSVIANDANGEQVAPGNEIHFFLIDAPMFGFPGSGNGSFLIAGSNGNPLEGGFDFFADGAMFISKGTLPSYRLVLDGVNFGFAPNNRDLTGIRTVNAVVSETQLRVSTAFNTNSAGDNGGTVPFVAGAAQRSNILGRGFTNTFGVASTFLTYPADRLGQTAILVACTPDREVCGVLNTCDATGADCGSVFLPISDGTNIALTTSVKELGPNTSTPVTLCLKDLNFAPVQATAINYDIGSFLGSAAVMINDSDALSGAVFTGADGCVTIVIASSGQLPGTEPIPIVFDADDVAEPVTININGPGAGKLTGTASCDLAELSAFIDANRTYQQCLAITDPTVLSQTPQCLAAGFRVVLDISTDPPTPVIVAPFPPEPPETITCDITLLLTDDRGGPITGVVIQYTSEGTVLDSVTFDPVGPTDNTGLTDDNGQTTATVVYLTGGETTITFSAGAATFVYTLNTGLE